MKHKKISAQKLLASRQGSTIVAVMASVVFIGIVAAAMIKNTSSQVASTMGYASMNTMYSSAHSALVATEGLFQNNDVNGVGIKVLNAVYKLTRQQQLEARTSVLAGVGDQKRPLGGQGQYIRSQIMLFEDNFDAQFNIESGKNAKGREMARITAFYNMDVELELEPLPGSNALYMSGRLRDGNNGMDVVGGATFEQPFDGQNDPMIFRADSKGKGDVYFHDDFSSRSSVVEFQTKVYFNRDASFQNLAAATKPFLKDVGVNGSFYNNTANSTINVGGNMWLNGDVRSGTPGIGTNQAANYNIKNDPAPNTAQGTFNYTENLGSRSRGNPPLDICVQNPKPAVPAGCAVRCPPQGQQCYCQGDPAQAQHCNPAHAGCIPLNQPLPAGAVLCTSPAELGIPLGCGVRCPNATCGADGSCGPGFEGCVWQDPSNPDPGATLGRIQNYDTQRSAASEPFWDIVDRMDILPLECRREPGYRSDHPEMLAAARTVTQTLGGTSTTRFNVDNINDVYRRATLPADDPNRLDWPLYKDHLVIRVNENVNFPSVDNTKQLDAKVIFLIGHENGSPYSLDIGSRFFNSGPNASVMVNVGPGAEVQNFGVPANGYFRGLVHVDKDNTSEQKFSWGSGSRVDGAVLNMGTGNSIWNSNPGNPTVPVVIKRDDQALKDFSDLTRQMNRPAHCPQPEGGDDSEDRIVTREINANRIPMTAFGYYFH